MRNLLLQEARRKLWLEMQQEWDQGEPKWEVEVSGIQICLQSTQQAGGRFMLAADNAHLAGRCLKARGLNAIHLDMDKVPALTKYSPASDQNGYRCHTVYVCQALLALIYAAFYPGL